MTKQLLYVLTLEQYAILILYFLILYKKGQNHEGFCNRGRTIGSRVKQKKKIKYLEIYKYQVKVKILVT